MMQHCNFLLAVLPVLHFCTATPDPLHDAPPLGLSEASTTLTSGVERRDLTTTTMPSMTTTSSTVTVYLSSTDSYSYTGPTSSATYKASSTYSATTTAPAIVTELEMIDVLASQAHYDEALHYLVYRYLSLAYVNVIPVDSGSVTSRFPIHSWFAEDPSNFPDLARAFVRLNHHVDALPTSASAMDFAERPSSSASLADYLDDYINAVDNVVNAMNSDHLDQLALLMALDAVAWFPQHVFRWEQYSKDQETRSQVTATFQVGSPVAVIPVTQTVVTDASRLSTMSSRWSMVDSTGLAKRIVGYTSSKSVASPTPAPSIFKTKTDGKCEAISPDWHLHCCPDLEQLMFYNSTRSWKDMCSAPQHWDHNCDHDIFCCNWSAGPNGYQACEKVPWRYAKTVMPAPSSTVYTTTVLGAVGNKARRDDEMTTATGPTDGFEATEYHRDVEATPPPQLSTLIKDHHARRTQPLCASPSH